MTKVYVPAVPHLLGSAAAEQARNVILGSQRARAQVSSTCPLRAPAQIRGMLLQSGLAPEAICQEGACLRYENEQAK